MSFRQKNIIGRYKKTEEQNKQMTEGRRTKQTDDRRQKYRRTKEQHVLMFLCPNKLMIGDKSTEEQKNNMYLCSYV